MDKIDIYSKMALLKKSFNHFDLLRIIAVIFVLFKARTTTLYKEVLSKIIEFVSRLQANK